MNMQTKLKMAESSGYLKTLACKSPDILKDKKKVGNYIQIEETKMNIQTNRMITEF